MNMLARLVAVSALTAAFTSATPSVAQNALTLVDVTDTVDQIDVPSSFNFFAGASSTTLSFAGYNVNDFTQLAALSVQQEGSGPNLLTGVFTFIPAAEGSFAVENGQNIAFGGTTVGSYDTFNTTFASMIGASYTLNYLLSVAVAPNGLVVTASDASFTAPASIAAAAPEPATWVMMILGFGLAGAALRCQVRRSEANLDARIKRIAKAAVA